MKRLPEPSARVLSGLVLALASLAAASPAVALDLNVAKEAGARLDPKRIGESLDALCAPEMTGCKSGTPGAKKVTAFIAKGFEQAGLAKLDGQGSFVVATDGGDENVLGCVPGGDRAQEAVVISAPWDGIGVDENGKIVPGANDNGSGVAALLEAARVLAAAKPRRTIVFAAMGGSWDKDSARCFRGAKDFVKKAAKLKLVFDVDMRTIGVPILPSEPERFFALGSETSAEVAAVLKETAAGTNELKLACVSVDLVEKRGACGDYEAFRGASVPFVFLTSGVSKDHHKPGDVPAGVDPRRIIAAARVAIDLLARIDALDAPPAYAKELLSDDRADAQEVLGLVEAGLDPKSGIVMNATERKALEFKRDKIKGMLEDDGELHLSVRDRGTLRDSLELLVLLLTH